jgi:SAM-dependent methyltransferase
MAQPPGCDPSCGCGANEFGEAEVRRELRRYRRSGPPPTTSWLIEGLREGGVSGLTVLDIGAGVGAVHQALLASGASAAIDIDGSPAFVAAAREEAERQGTADRVQHQIGDFVELAPEIEPADIVVLDRVICCYPDMRALVSLSVARARRRYGLVYPRDSWWNRAGSTLLNGWSRLTRQRIRAYVHPTAAVDEIVRAAGLRPILQRTNLFWQVAVYERLA